MNGRPFFDTNVLIYAVGRDDPRQAVARKLISAGGMISVQVLNEFVSVARRKLHMPWQLMKEVLQAFQILFPDPVPITINTHRLALTIAESYGYNIYDSVIAASALEADCNTLFSEDFQDGQRIEERLTVRNPFK
jgi:predicted nucleic acid-binding protein